MNKLRFLPALLLIIVFPLFSCKSTPDTGNQEQAEVTPPAELKAEEPGVPIQSEGYFDPSTISREQYETEKTEIEALVEVLNAITSSKDYNRWLGYLSDEYREFYSNPDVLKAQTSRLPVKNLQLKNLKDYFNYVFVLSRQKCRVDDITYITPTRVKVIQKEPGKSLIIYNLEKFDGKWKLVLDN